MLVIRFRRVGKKNKPTYRVVVGEHTWTPSGKFTADLGSYNPHSKATTLKKEEAVEWLNKGAKPSNSVAKLFEKEKIKHNSVVVIKKKRSPKKTAEAKAVTSVVAPQAEETAQVAETSAPEPSEVADETSELPGLPAEDAVTE